MNQVLYSFDVFDTVLVRTWAKPTDLFWEMGNQLFQYNLITTSAETWHDLRIKAEITARQKSATTEVTLKQIYEELAYFLNWSQLEIEQALKLEIQIEQNVLRSVPENQQKIQGLRQAKQKLIYISDMYLPHEVIKRFLHDNHLWEEGDALFVSGGIGTNKASGQLFHHVLSEKSYKASHLIHTGDNLHADVNVPKKLGIQVRHFSQTHLNRYEQLIAENDQLPLKFRSLLAGASRLTRLQCQETDLHKQVIWNTAASVIGPLLFSFVHWCLLEAQNRGIQRLYFVARDGQILLKIAQIICNNWEYSIDCRYLYGSRQAWHFPAIQEIGEVEFDWMFEKTEFLSIRSVCRRVNLKVEQIEFILDQNGFPKETWDENLSDQSLASLKQIFGKQEIIERIVTQVGVYRDKTIGYFRQEGIGDGKTFGIVDIGWTGRTLRSFSSMLANAGIYPEEGLQGFYFGLARKVKAFPQDDLQSFFVEPEQFEEKRSICHGDLIELFVAADHGSTVRYELQGNRYIPVLRVEKNVEALEWGLQVQQKAITNFAAQLTTNLNQHECRIIDFKNVTESLLGAFAQSPSVEESEVFGSFLLSGQQTETSFYELAPAYSLSDSIKILFKESYMSQIVWLPASLNRSHSWLRTILAYHKRRRLSYTYVQDAWVSMGNGDLLKANQIAITALKLNPALIFSKGVIRLYLLLFVKKYRFS